MTDAGVDLERIAADDRADARRRQIAMGDHTPTLLGGAIILGFFAVLALLFLGYAPDGNKEILLILTGSLGAMTGNVVNFFFGSSKGSKNKDQMITAMQGQAR